MEDENLQENLEKLTRLIATFVVISSIDDVQYSVDGICLERAREIFMK